MKASVLIKNGRTEIILLPENNFEIEVIERVINDKYEITKTEVDSDYSYQEHSDHKITIEINRPTKKH